MTNILTAHDDVPSNVNNVTTGAGNRTAAEFLASLNVDIIPLGGVRESTKGFEIEGISDGVSSEYKEIDS